MDIITKGLNEKQKEAVESNHQTTLVLAGAGTGKTKVLTSRIAYLISLGVEASSVLAVTFTNKAAGEMKKRTIDMVNGINLDSPFYENDLSIGTFHSICHKMLRRHADLAGLNKDFQVLDADEQKKLVKEVVEDKLKMGSEISDKKEKTKFIKQTVGVSLKAIGDFKDEGIRPKDLGNSSDIYHHYGFDLKKVYQEYEDEKDRLGMLDFGDLILGVVELLSENAKLKETYQSRYRHILVDEFQDTNTIQFKLINLLYDKEDSYLFVVGDDDQSIYEWRGAKIENILNFDKTYKGTLTVKLEQNYRSTNNILKCANHLIQYNENRKGKNLWSDKDSGNNIVITHTNNAYAEADKVAQEIKRRVKRGADPSEFAILYRSNFISRIIESKLNENQIAYTIIGGTGFWSRLEVKDLMSYLALSMNLNNNMAFDRVVNLPSRKLGPKKLEQIKRLAEDADISRFKALETLLENNQIKGEAGKNAKAFVKLINDADKEDGLVERLSHLLESSELVDYYLNKDGEEKGEEREQNLNELINAASTFKNENPDEDDALAFIDYAVLQSTADKESDGNSVQMMTVHAAKGLEFPKVFLMGWEDGVFPSESSMKEGKLEEERRLAYVAITRAEKELFISVAGERHPKTPIPPSRFLQELPTEIIEVRRETYSNHQNFYGQKRESNNWNKSRSIEGYKIGSKYEHSRFGDGIILNAINIGDKIQITVNFKGLIGIKKLFVEKK